MKQSVQQGSLVLVYYHPGFDEWWIIQSEYSKNEVVCDVDCDISTGIITTKFKDLYIPYEWVADDPNANPPEEECGIREATSGGGSSGGSS